MALTPTEREEHFFKAMVDAADGSTPEELEPTERKEHWYKEIIDAIAAGGGGSGGGGVLVVHDVDDTLDKTWQEIHDAMLSGGAVIDDSHGSAEAVARAYQGKTGYIVGIPGDGSAAPLRYSASSASDYPVRQQN